MSNKNQNEKQEQIQDKNPGTRSKILAATTKLLVENQGKGVRMSDIAKQVGISRQALYLHFKTRTELLVASTHYLDEVLDVDKRLQASREAQTGTERLACYIEAWGNYIPEIYGVAKALMVMQESDDAAATAWSDRMQAMREGCQAAIKALINDGDLVDTLKEKEAVDLLWTLLSVRNWENLTIECGWSNKKYVEQMKQMAGRAFVKTYEK